MVTARSELSRIRTDSSAIHVPLRQRIVFVQFGDYAEAVHRFAAGGKEDYYAQKYTVDFVAGLVPRFGSATVVTFSREKAFERLPNGVGAQGVLLYPPGGKARHDELIRVVESLHPTQLIVVAPNRPLIGWAIRKGFRTLPLFADSFCAPGLRNRARQFLLRRLLNRPEIPWVANHSIAASLDLVRIGVDPRKVLPFDWPPIVSPLGTTSKEPPASGPFRLLYVGQLTEAKGVGDALRALPRLPSCTLTVVGAGPDEESLHRIPAAVGVSDRVTFRGKISHGEVLSEMKAHDAVLVPSRPEYPEGLPMTIYEALCSRTPVVVSDHPMFQKRVAHDVNGIMFRAADPASLAQAVERLRTTPDLYRKLSVNAGPAAEKFLLPLKWHLLLDLWLQGDAVGDASLATFAVGNRVYS
jgi:glycosyltransferase involved in cell wall biosynthesis